MEGIEITHLHKHGITFVVKDVTYPTIGDEWVNLGDYHIAFNNTRVEVECNHKPVQDGGGATPHGCNGMIHPNIIWRIDAKAARGHFQQVFCLNPDESQTMGVLIKRENWKVLALFVRNLLNGSPSSEDLHKRTAAALKWNNE